MKTTERIPGPGEPVKFWYRADNFTEEQNRDYFFQTVLKNGYSEDYARQLGDQWAREWAERADEKKRGVPSYIDYSLPEYNA